MNSHMIFLASLDPCPPVTDIDQSYMPLNQKIQCDMQGQCPAGFWCHHGPNPESTVCCRGGAILFYLKHTTEAKQRFHSYQKSMWSINDNWSRRGKFKSLVFQCILQRVHFVRLQGLAGQCKQLFHKATMWTSMSGWENYKIYVHILII